MLGLSSTFSFSLISVLDGRIYLWHLSLFDSSFVVTGGKVVEEAKLPSLLFPMWPGGRKQLAMYLSSP